MDKILIRFDERDFLNRKRNIDAVCFELNKLIDSLYTLNIVGDSGINLNDLLHDDMYLNKLISQRKDVVKMGFRNINELHRLYIDDIDYDSFQEVRKNVLTTLKKVRVPLNYYSLVNGLISINEKEVEKLKLNFQHYAENNEQVQAYFYLKDICDTVNKLNDKFASGSILNGRGINMHLFRYSEGKITPSLNGVNTVSQSIEPEKVSN